jgi:hypothetical protein
MRNINRETIINLIKDIRTKEACAKLIKEIKEKYKLV